MSQPGDRSRFSSALHFELNRTCHRSLLPLAALGNTARTVCHLALLSPQAQQIAAYTPPAGADRVRWVPKASFGWKSLAAGVFDAALETAADRPKEWRGTWEGFGKRFGTRQAGLAMSNSIEAGLGAFWGEDPRYLPYRRSSVWPRTRYALKTTLLARNRSGELKPAIARYIGFVGNNFITNTWRPRSENDWNHALIRSGLAIVSRTLSNLLQEFWR